MPELALKDQKEKVATLKSDKTRLDHNNKLTGELLPPDVLPDVRTARLSSRKLEFGCRTSPEMASPGEETGIPGDSFKESCVFCRIAYGIPPGKESRSQEQTKVS